MVRSKASHEKTPQECRNGFRIHLMVYAIVNAGLVILDLTRSPEKLWFFWPLGGWGLGLALHAWLVYRQQKETPQEKHSAPEEA